MELAVYLDESGIHQGSEVLTVAGYLAYNGLWKCFQEEWRTTLSAQNLDSFHMTDFENSRKMFKGWSDQKRVRLLSKLIKIIRRRLAFGVSVSVRLGDFSKVVPVKTTRDRNVGAYTIGVVDCSKKVERWARSQNANVPVDYFIETGSRLARVVPKVWNHFSRQERESMLMGSLQFKSKKDNEFQPNFEAADILAYESWKFFSSYGSGKIRRSFKKLLRSHDFGHCFTASDIKRLFEEFCPPDQWDAYLAQFEGDSPGIPLN